MCCYFIIKIFLQKGNVKDNMLYQRYLDAQKCIWQQHL